MGLNAVKKGFCLHQDIGRHVPQHITISSKLLLQNWRRKMERIGTRWKLSYPSFVCFSSVPVLLVWARWITSSGVRNHGQNCFSYFVVCCFKLSKRSNIENYSHLFDDYRKGQPVLIHVLTDWQITGCPRIPLELTANPLWQRFLDTGGEAVQRLWVARPVKTLLEKSW